MANEKTGEIPDVEPADEFDLSLEFASRDMFSKAYVETRVKAMRERIESLEREIKRERLEYKMKFEKLGNIASDFESKFKAMRTWSEKVSARLAKLEKQDKPSGQ